MCCERRASEIYWCRPEGRRLYFVDEPRQGEIVCTGSYPRPFNISSQREVIPVDTHVHQIAIKHYGLRGASGSKANMTPKLYDEVNAKLAKVWGDYAGWAHSVKISVLDLKILC